MGGSGIDQSWRFRFRRITHRLDSIIAPRTALADSNRPGASS